MRLGADRASSAGWASAAVAAALTALFLLAAGPARLSDDQINYVAIADRILESPPGSVLWVPYRTFSFLLAGLFGLTHDHILSLKLVFAAVTFAYLLGIKKFLSIYFKNSVVAWTLAAVSMTPGYTLGMTFWGFGGFELVLARTVFMALAPWVLYLFWGGGDGRKAAALVACAAGAALNLEALLLLAVMVLHLAAQILPNRAAWRRLAGPLGVALAAAAVISIVIYYIPVFRREDVFFNLTPIYRSIIAAERGFIESLSRSEFIDAFWDAAYACCWWTLFPPRASDLAFAVANQAVLIASAIAGWRVWSRSADPARRNWALWAGCVVAAAYGYQVLRYAGWKWFDMPPHIFEEVRAFKFLHPFLFLCAGALLQSWWRERRRAAFVCLSAALLVSPLSTLRGLPQDWKEEIQRLAARALKDPAQLGYVAKALALRDPAREEDLRRITEVLLRDTDPDAFVLSAEYALRLSGRRIMVLYNDKRNGDQEFDGQVYARLPYWHRAHLRVLSALGRGDAREIAGLAREYRCDFAVVPAAVDGSGWTALYRGSKLSLYRLSG